MRRPMTEPSAVTAATATYSGGHCKRFAMSSIHGASASGMNSELNGSTGANPFGSGFGSGHSQLPRSRFVCTGAFSLPLLPAIRSFL